jgi:hypothetical protein
MTAPVVALPSAPCLTAPSSKSRVVAPQSCLSTTARLLQLPQPVTPPGDLEHHRRPQVRCSTLRLWQPHRRIGDPLWSHIRLAIREKPEMRVDMV